MIYFCLFIYLMPCLCVGKQPCVWEAGAAVHRTQRGGHEGRGRLRQGQISRRLPGSYTHRKASPNTGMWCLQRPYWEFVFILLELFKWVYMTNFIAKMWGAYTAHAWCTFWRSKDENLSKGVIVELLWVETSYLWRRVRSEILSNWSFDFIFFGNFLTFLIWSIGKNIMLPNIWLFWHYITQEGK